jgi:hypothetical protein
MAQLETPKVFVPSLDPRMGRREFFSTRKENVSNFGYSVVSKIAHLRMSSVRPDAFSVLFTMAK